MNLFALILLAAIPLHLPVDISRPTSPAFPAYHGESLEIEAELKDRGTAFNVALTSPQLYYQTPGMGNNWWTLPATQTNNLLRATFPASADPGEDRLICFLGSAGENFRASFILNFRHAPGAVPNTVELPVPTLDFSQITVLNPPYVSTDTYTNTTAALEAGIEAVSNALVAAEADLSAAIAAATPADYNTVKDQVSTNAADIAALKTGKQDSIADLSDIRAGAALGATALQEHQSLTNYYTRSEVDTAVAGATPSDYNTVKTQVSSNAIAIAGLAEVVAALDPSVATNIEELATLSTTVAGLQAEMSNKADSSQLITVNWADDVTINNRAGAGGVIYFKPSVFGMPRGGKITSFTVRTSDTIANSGTFYAKIIDPDNSAVAMCVSAAQTMPNRDTVYTFTFPTPVSLPDVDKQYIIAFYSGAADGSPLSSIYLRLSVGSASDLWFYTSTWRPIMTVTYTYLATVMRSNVQMELRECLDGDGRTRIRIFRQ